LPNLFRRLLGEGALTAALVPTLHDELKARERAGAFALVNQVASWLLSSPAGSWCWRWSRWRKRARWSAGRGRWASTTTRRCASWRRRNLRSFSFPIWSSSASRRHLVRPCETLHRFVEPALSPIWLNLAMIGMLGGAV